jgi:hypothetical protein
MKRAWALGVVAILALAMGCGGSGGGTGGDGGGTLPDGGTPDGGCTGASCNPGDGGTDGGATGAITATPDRIVIGTTPGAAKTAQLTLQNTGGSTVSLQSLNVSGSAASAFSVSGANVPMNLAAGASATLTVSFNGAAGVSKAMLAAATPAGTTNVPLGGLAIPAGTEPSLQWIFDVHNIPVNAGNPDPTKKDFPPVPIAGDEMGIQSFVKAGAGPVTLQLLGSFGPDFEPVSINGWYVSGNASSRTELFRIAQANHFALDPPVENGGSLSFDPGANAFGFWNEWPFWEGPQGMGQYFVYLEDALNTWDTGTGGTKHHMRVYPYKNPDGTADPHAFIVTTEEAPISAGPDYNDVVYVVRNVKPATSGGAGALQFLNGDGEPSSNRMMFNVITTIASCWGPLTVKDSGTVTVKNTSGGTVNVSSIDTTDAFTATPSMGLPAALAPGASIDVAVKFTATQGRVHNGTLNVHSDDSMAPTATFNLAGFRQDIPQNSFFPQTSTEPDLDEVVNGLYGYATVVGTKQQLFDMGEQRIAVGDEVLSSYWVKADGSQPVSMRLLSAWHSGWDCGDPSAVSFGSFAYWFPKGRTSANDDRYILGGAKEDIQRVLPRGYESPATQAANTFDPGSTVFGFHIELEFSDESLLGPLDIEPECQPVAACGHRIRFWPLKDASGSVRANTWIVSIDMHRPATPTDPKAFFSNYDYNDETYLVQNMKPAP